MTNFDWLPIFYKIYIKNSKGKLMLLATLLFLQALVLVLVPLPLKEVFDNLDNKSYFLQMIGLSFGLSLISLALDYFGNLMTVNQNRDLQFVIRSYFMKNILAQPYRYHLQKNKMLLVNNLNKDIMYSEDLFTRAIVAVLRSVPSIIFLLVALMIIEPIVFVLVAVGFPIYFFLTRRVLKTLKEVEKDLLHKEQVFEQNTFQTFECLGMAKSLSKQESLSIKLNNILDDVKESLRKKILITAKMNVTLKGVKIFMAPLLIFIGGLAIYYEKISLGDLFVIASYLGSLQRPVFKISRLWTKLPKGLGSLERLMTLDNELEQYSQSAENFNENSGEFTANEFLEIRNVSHSWDSEVAPFIEVEELKIKKGEMVTFMGPSGAGKSSLLKFLNRLIDPLSGQISLNGEDIKSLSLNELRKKIRIVLQDNFLLSASVRENISLSDSKHSDAKIWESLKLVCAEDFVKELPQGLETIIGSGGHPLSGGQAKRINLARSILDYSKVDVIGLDEPTTGLDQANAKKMISNFKDLSRTGKTVIWITHNVAEMDVADRRFLFQDNLVKEVTNDES